MPSFVVHGFPGVRFRGESLPHQNQRRDRSRHGENFLKATSLIAQTTLRSVIGQAELDELLSQREKINQRLQEIIDRQTEPWGNKSHSR